jgi:hypothetical protein
MVRGAIVTEKDPKRRAKAKRNPARRARDLATSRNRNSWTTRADHRKITITKKKRQNRKLRRIFYYLILSSCLRSIIFFISKAIFSLRYIHIVTKIYEHSIYMEVTLNNNLFVSRK